MPETPDTPDTQDTPGRVERGASVRTLVVHWEDPSLGPLLAAERGLNGIEYLRAIMRGEIPPPPITRLMDIELVEVEDGRVVFAATPGEQHYNPIGVVHGGLAATLLDSAIGCAMQTKAPPGFFYTTIELKINYVRPCWRVWGAYLARLQSCMPDAKQRSRKRESWTQRASSTPMRHHRVC